MTVEFEESGMRFGPYPKSHFFLIEKSAVFKRAGPGLKIAEFVLLRAMPTVPCQVWCVEAKSSSPKELVEFTEAIRQKMATTLQLTIAACLNRHPEAANELPDGFKTLDLTTCMFKCVLVVNGLQKAHLPQLQEALVKTLKPLLKLWGADPGKSVLVLNDEGARKVGLIA